MTPGCDANQDGKVDIQDATKVELIIMELNPPTAGADADGDGSITMADVIRIEMLVLGITGF